jgi:hypothetical protein
VDYKQAIHKVCTKLRFCEKEPLEEEKIEKTLQTMLPSNWVLQQQYRAQNYQRYADLIHDLLQAEKHDELTIKNHHQHHVGAAPLRKIHNSEKKLVLLRIPILRKMVCPLVTDAIGIKIGSSQRR